MLETMKAIISQYLPSIVAITTTIASIITFFAKVKSLVKNNDAIVNSLTTNLKNAQEEIYKLTNKCLDNEKSLAESLKTLNENNEELTIRNNNLVHEVETLQEEARDLATIRQQLREVLRDKGE